MEGPNSSLSLTCRVYECTAQVEVELLTAKSSDGRCIWQGSQRARDIIQDVGSLPVDETKSPITRILYWYAVARICTLHTPNRGSGKTPILERLIKKCPAFNLFIDCLPTDPSTILLESYVYFVWLFVLDERSITYVFRPRCPRK